MPSGRRSTFTATNLNTVCLLTQRRRPHALPSGINYALKLLLASGTGECLSLVFESVFRGRSAPG